MGDVIADLFWLALAIGLVIAWHYGNEEKRT